MEGIPFIGENGFYPKWAKRGQWVFQRTLISVASVPGFAELAAAQIPTADQIIVWVPYRKLSHLVPSRVHEERQRALRSLYGLKLICYGKGCDLGHDGIATTHRSLNETTIYPQDWRLICPSCSAACGPDLSVVSPEPIVDKWHECGQPRLEDPGASVLFRSAKPIENLPRWIEQHSNPSQLELAYLGQQLW